jgi:glucose/arabinose dehydrogenase
MRFTSFVTVPLLLAAAAAMGQPGEVLKGREAMGDWRQDRPGLRRLLRVEDMPEKTAPTYGEAKVVPMPAGAMPKVPEGFTIEMVASGLAQPRAIRFSPGGDLFVSDSEPGLVRIYRFSGGGSQPSEEGVFASGLNKPYGIAFYPPGERPEWVYIANTDGVVRFKYTPGDLKAAGEAEPVVKGILWTHHWTRDIQFAPDGSRLYLAVGSGSNVALDMFPAPRVEGGLDGWNKANPVGAAWDTEEHRANILSYTPEGGDPKIYATGLRNPAGIAIQPRTGTLWAVVNERDELGDDTPLEYATSVKEGAFYGWPWYYLGDHEDPRQAGKRPDLKGRVTLPDVYIQAHTAPLQIAFADSDRFGPGFKGDAFVALHGSWNRAKRVGYKVIRLPFDESGKPTGETEDFVTGFVTSDSEVWGRPVGVAVSKDGALFVSEDGNGTIWRIDRK